MRSFTRISVPATVPLLPLPSAVTAPSLGQTACVQMLASLQSVLPSSVLSSLSTSPTAKNRPPQGPADGADDRDNYPSPSSNVTAMSVDEQGVRKKKGRSNEVSPPSPPQVRMRFFASSLTPQPLGFPPSPVQTTC